MAEGSSGPDETVQKQMAGLMELLTTSGKNTLNPDIMKKFKKICRISDSHVKYAYELLMTQLSVDHSEVRLSTFQMMSELFERSHAFRELLLTDFQTFLELTAGTDPSFPLPAPKAAAIAMKTEAYKTIQRWYEKFAGGYKKLILAYNYLKTCKKIDFDSIQARNAAEEQMKLETERKLEEARKEKLDKVLAELKDCGGDIQLCLTGIENGIELLMPKPDDFFISLTDPVSTTNTECKTVISTDNTVVVRAAQAQKRLVANGEARACDSSDGANSESYCSCGRNVKARHSNISEDGGHVCACDSMAKKLSGQCNEEQSCIETSKHCSQSDKDGMEAGKIKCKHKTTGEAKEQQSVTDAVYNAETECNGMVSSVSGTLKLDKVDNALTGHAGTNNEHIEERTAETDGGKEVEDGEEDGVEDGDEEEDDDDFDDVEEDDDFIKDHGMFTHQFELTVGVGGPSGAGLQVTDDNKDIVQEVRDQYRLVKNRYLAKVRQWREVLGHCKAKKEDIDRVASLQERLEDVVRKCLELEVIAGNAHGKDSDSGV